MTQQAVRLGEGNFILSAHGDSEGFIPLRSKAVLFQLKALRVLHGSYGAHSRFQVQDAIYNPCRTQKRLPAEFYIYATAS